VTRLLVCLAFLMLPSVAAADGLEEAERLYQSGNMLEARRVAQATDSADGYALAAKAALVDALYMAPEHERETLLEGAADDASRALERQPNHIDALLRLAVALGHLAEGEDLVSAHLKGYGYQGRELLERALALQPENSWANGLLGIWHLQVVYNGGPALAGELYEASEAEGRRLCRRALELDPEATSIRFGCARSLLELDPEANRAAAIEDLRRVVEAPVDDVADRLLRERAWQEIRRIRQTS
jgi:tetratricopeptide (TPR) repeat protein